MHFVTQVLTTLNRAPSVPSDCQIHEGESHYEKDSIQITTTGDAADSGTFARPSCTQRMEGQQDPAIALGCSDWRWSQRKLLQRYDGGDAGDAGWRWWTFRRNSSAGYTASCQSEEGQEEAEGLISANCQSGNGTTHEDKRLKRQTTALSRTFQLLQQLHSYRLRLISDRVPRESRCKHAE